MGFLGRARQLFMGSTLPGDDGLMSILLRWNGGFGTRRNQSRTFTFEGNEATVSLETTDGGKRELHGETME
jgi:hypothetical protein